ncbi:MAG: SpoIIE family protein phosphatase [Planctomycetota bacterium]
MPRRISTRLTIYFLALTLIPLAIFAWWSFEDGQEHLRTLLSDELYATAASKAREIEQHFHERKRDIATLSGTMTVAESLRVLVDVVHRKGIDSPEYAAEDARVRPYLTAVRDSSEVEDLLLIAPDGVVVWNVIGGKILGTSLRTGPFSRSPLQGVWDRASTLLDTEISDFEVDVGLREPVAFVGSPVFHKGEVIGVAAMRLSNAEVNRLAQDYIGLGKTGETLVGTQIGNDAVFITSTRHDAKAAYTRKAALGSAQDVPLQLAVQGKRGRGTAVDYRGKEVLAAWRYLPSVRWGLVVKMDEREVFAPIERMRLLTLETAASASILVTIIAFLVARSFSRPLIRLASHAERLIQTDFKTTEAPLQGKQLRDASVEVALLADSFVRMQRRLIEYLESLKSTTAAKERIESDVRIARDIQLALLPKVFSPFPGQPRVHLHALMEPAKEVGGDLYDYEFLDDERLLIAVGDVSDKGVGAALFGAMTKTLLRTGAAMYREPENIAGIMNRELARGNETCQFVTMWIGIANVKTGVVEYADAGHNPPLLLRAGGKPEYLKKIPKGGLPLAVMEDCVYKRGTLTLAPGDLLVVYTDGVTEARNPAGGLYGDARLVETMLNGGAMTTRETIQTVLADVRTYAGTAPQSDDITVLALRFSDATQGPVTMMRPGLKLP